MTPQPGHMFFGLERLPNDRIPIVIDRMVWARGASFGKHGNLLYVATRPIHNMCCLGILAEQCGVPKAQLLEVVTPAGIDPLPIVLNFLVQKSACDVMHPANSPVAELLMHANDSDVMTDDEREVIITTTLAEHGFAVTFTG